MSEIAFTQTRKRYRTELVKKTADGLTAKAQSVRLSRPQLRLKTLAIQGKNGADASLTEDLTLIYQTAKL